MGRSVLGGFTTFGGAPVLSVWGQHNKHVDTSSFTRPFCSWLTLTAFGMWVRLFRNFGTPLSWCSQEIQQENRSHFGGPRKRHTHVFFSCLAGVCKNNITFQLDGLQPQPLWEERMQKLPLPLKSKPPNGIGQVALSISCGLDWWFGDLNPPTFKPPIQATK